MMMKVHEGLELHFHDDGTAGVGSPSPAAPLVVAFKVPAGGGGGVLWCAAEAQNWKLGPVAEDGTAEATADDNPDQVVTVTPLYAGALTGDGLEICDACGYVFDGTSWVPQVQA